MKINLLQRARGVVNVRMVPEAYWHVGIEAMLCGTPVVAFNHSSYTEIIKDGVSGFLCDDNEKFLNAMHKIDTLDRRSVRKYALQFSRTKIVGDRIPVLKAVAGGKTW